MIQIYEYTSQPPYWIVHDQDGYWLVPVLEGGWEDRSPFIGHVTSLRPIHPQNAGLLGIPHTVVAR